MLIIKDSKRNIIMFLFEIINFKQSVKFFVFFNVKYMVIIKYLKLAYKN